MQPLSGNQRPDLLTSLMNMSLVLRLPRKMHLSRSSSNVPRLPSFLDKTFTFCSLLTRCTIPCASHAKRHLNVQECFESVIFLHSWLRNVLRATTACTFSTCQLPKVVRAWCALCMLTWKSASRHSGVHFLNIPKALRDRQFFRQFVNTFWLWNVLRASSHHNGMHFFDISTSKNSPKHVVSCTFWLPHVIRATRACHLSSLIIGKTQHNVSRLSYLFAHLHLLSSDSFSSLVFSLTLPISTFHLSILSEVWVLNFLRLSMGLIWVNHGKPKNHPSPY